MDTIQNNIKNDFLINKKKSSKIEIIKNPILLLIVCLLIFEVIYLLNCLPINIWNKKEIKNRVLSDINYKLSNILNSENYSFKAIYFTSSDNQLVSLFNETYTKEIL